MEIAAEGKGKAFWGSIAPKRPVVQIKTVQPEEDYFLVYLSKKSNV
jgi:hypothetical protein